MPAIARPGMLKSDRNGKFREFVQEVSNCVVSQNYFTNVVTVLVESVHVCSTFHTF